MAKNKKKPASAPAAPPAKKKSPVVPLTIGVIAVVVVIAIIAGGGANTTTFVDGQASRTIATVDECASTTLPLAVPEGQTMEDVAAGVFEGLSRTNGVGVVTVYENDPRVNIEYCQSYSSDPTLREVIGQAGYLGQ
ncbi:MAG: hypothetical protein RQ731_00840 [Anaerosomatales bacterium]|nr:hypothetical protein [Anaerosomatales bacterium]MDT8433300.1 hypothetical protein [Anaerosomatales bacterium]